ncbi:efflux RND transporter periplasmic adaptor subunit [Mesonia maritima]|uniref:Multidrug efflux pump subunit AcrA (Membrane-fusion protein) n=1 Tax=Mesonia maritima TaxID=1793873 RepID=A0ABU1K4J1_9FLAO|nr:HlyD family efflux transporter periplasmic adaptor subunit [Mesonia maritima]MDR6300231.1 multidrug efflux pump subunit AcrA (membrane-fusion protein) [Mesonia maritima]
MRKFISIFIGLIILIGASALAYYLIDSNKKEKPPVKKVVKTVFVDTVQNKTIPIQLPANGTLVAKNRIELFSEVQGVFQYSAKEFRPGQTYNRGQVLLKLNAQEYTASVQSAKSELYNQIAAIMPDLRLDYPEVFPKWEKYLNNYDLNKTTPKLPEISNSKERYFITGRGILSTYYNVKNLEERLVKYTIVAPFDGVLTEAVVTKGALVRQGQKLGEFIDPSVYELEVSIAKEYSDLLKEGEKVSLTDLEGKKDYTGTVSRINASIDQNTQSIRVYIEVKNDALKEGMYLEAQLEAKKVENAILIDRKLLVDQTQLYIVRENVLDLVEVNPVYTSEKKAVIKGLKDGTKYIKKPVPGAYAGMPIKIFQDKKQAKTND